jgi:uncharacterized protein (TIGR03435 family)
MLQTLLADRFQLKIHRETRELPVYALTVAKGGLKLKPAEGSCTFPGLKGPPPGAAGGPPRDTLIGAWALVPEMLGGRLDRPIIDKTGLTADSYCTLDGDNPVLLVLTSLGPGGAGRGQNPQLQSNIPDDFGSPSIFDVVEEKLGLKLEKQKGSVDILVIDHVERPSEN